MALAGLPDDQRERVRAIARHFGIPDRQLTVAPRQGQVNLTVFLGDELVLRLPRKPKFEQRLVKESEVITAVVDRGIPTARVVSFDAGRTVVDANYIVLERLHGRSIDDWPSDPDSRDRAYDSMFEILSAVHTIPRSPDIAEVMPGEFDSVELLAELAAAGEIGETQAGWWQDWFERLESAGARSSREVLLHGDVMPSNVMVNESGAVTGIIDWGSACWAEAARDLAGFRTSALPPVVHAYRRAAELHPAASEQAGPGVLEASVLWYQLLFALAKLLGRPSTSEQRNWSAPRAARMLELLRFFTAEVPADWRAILHQETAAPMVYE